MNNIQCDFCFDKTFILHEKDGVLVKFCNNCPKCKQQFLVRYLTDDEEYIACMECNNSGYSYLSEGIFAGCSRCGSIHGGYAMVCNRCKKTYPVESDFLCAYTIGCSNCPKKQIEIVEIFESCFLTKMPEHLKIQIMEWAKNQPYEVAAYSYEY